MPQHCPNCGRPVDLQDKFCRECGTSLATGGQASTPAPGLTPESAANFWKYFFGPFFKTAFVFFACFFGMAFLLMIFWYFKFGG